MKLRLNLHITFALSLLFLFDSFITTASKSYEPTIPQEIKFADVTFQLNLQARAFIREELSSILSKRSRFSEELSDFTLALPLIEPILKENGIPDDFKYLLNFDKYQVGIEATIQIEDNVYWAFTRNNANEANLKINQLVDERKHLIAATKGFTYCVNQNQRKLNNWALSLFSHLAEDKVIDLLEIKTKWKNQTNLTIDNQAYLVILEFIAHKIAIESSFPASQAQNSRIIYQYPYGNGLNLNKIAADLKVEPTTLLTYNQWLKSPLVPDSDCKVLVVIPSNRFFEIQSLAQLSANKSKISSELAFPMIQRMEKLSKERNKGGNFFQINGLEGIQADICDAPVNLAYKAALPLDKFLDFNDLKENSLLKVGNVYYLEKKKSKAQVPFHVVREGESLWDISQIYGVRLDALMEFNRFDVPQRLKRGRVVWLQTTRPKNKPIEYVKLEDESFKEEAKLPVISEQDSTISQLTIEKPTEKVLREPAKIVDSIDELEPDNTIFANENIDIGLAPATDLSHKEIKITEQKSVSPVDYSEYFTYRVKENDTLFSVALLHKMSVEELFLLNSLQSAIIKKGMTLKIGMKK